MEKKPWEVVVAILAVVFLCMWGGSGCGSVSPATERLAPDAGAAGMIGGTGGINGAAGRMDGAGGAVGSGGTGSVMGTGGASMDAGVDVVTCVSVDGGHCDPNAQPCPAGVPLASCPKGTVKAGPNQSCPAGDRYVSLFDICVPAADAGP